jgi:hypothetical protein
VIAQEFIEEVGSQPERPTQRKDLKWSGEATECRAPGSVKEERRLAPYWHKTGRLQIELPNGMRQTWALQNTRQRSDQTGTPAWYRRTVLSVPHVACPEFAGASVNQAAVW